MARPKRVWYATGPSITDPSPHQGSSGAITMAPHPKDPGPSTLSQGSSPPPPPPPPANTTQASAAVPDPPPPPPEDGDPNNTPPVPVTPSFEHSHEDTESVSGLPSPHVSPSSYGSPPFDTYRFFSALEKTFPTTTARSLMRATRALLVDRIGRVKREGLTVKDIESVRSITCRFFVWVSAVPSNSKHTCSKLLFLSSAQNSPCVRVMRPRQCVPRVRPFDAMWTLWTGE